jgi:uncharacterized protein YdbL (DUF1318 family)
MQKTFGIVVSALLLSACVTINIYFPAAQAKEAAEAIVEDILQVVPSESPGNGVPAGDKDAAVPGASVWFTSLLDFLLPPAHAAQPDFAVNTPEIRRMQASLKQGQAVLNDYFDAGAIGFTHDGEIAVRDDKAVPLKERARLKQRVAEANKGYANLYRAVAAANGHPEWQSDVRAVFARTWIEKTKKGWFYRTAGGQWKRK